jgi:hypothetical protein
MQKSADHTSDQPLFFTAPTQATGLSNFTDYRTYTPSISTATTPSMAEEPPSPMVGGRGGFEQDKRMDTPVGGVGGE